MPTCLQAFGLVNQEEPYEISAPGYGKPPLPPSDDVLNIPGLGAVRGLPTHPYAHPAKEEHAMDKDSVLPINRWLKEFTSSDQGEDLVDIKK